MNKSESAVIRLLLPLPLQGFPKVHQSPEEAYSEVPWHPLSARGQTIWPYTDLLVHDMGPGLDDGVAEHGVTRSAEWRTAPLWGLGLAQRVNGKAGYLHDGRARTVDEAIRWHGGEAEGAKENYLALAPKDRQALLDWLQGL